MKPLNPSLLEGGSHLQRITMPRLDIDMESGAVVDWLKSENEPVNSGELLAKIMSLKVTVEIPSPASGFLHKIIVPKGKEVPVGQVLCIIREEKDSEEELQKAAEEAQSGPAAKAIAARTSSSKIVQEAEKAIQRVIASPLAKKMAEEHGIDLRNVVGTGPEGRIMKEDVSRLIDEVSQFSEVIPLAGTKKIVAERMSESFRTAPHATVVIDVDATQIVKMRDQFKREGTEISYNAFFLMAAAKALREFPIINSTLREDEIRVWKRINICLAVETPSGLVAPVIKDADQQSLVQLSRTAGELALKARENRLAVEELKEGTFTITSLGMFDVTQFQPIINPPQAAILAIASISPRPVAEHASVVIRPMVTLSLSFDHRIVDGAPAARFLGRVRDLLENPEK